MKNLIETVTTWNEVVKEFNNSTETDLPFPEPKNESQEAANAHWRITQTIKLFKQGKKCNYAPGNHQNKYLAGMCWNKLKSGLGFSVTDTDYAFPDTTVGPRLSSLSSEDAKHIATVVCKEDYEKYFNE